MSHKPEALPATWHRQATLMCTSAQATATLARRIAPELRPGDTLLLSGNLGAGKSHFARAAIRAAVGLLPDGREIDVPSPSYTLIQTYPSAQGQIWHADLYRLGATEEMIELGLDDAFTEAICFVEWPSRMGINWPDAAVCFALDPHSGADDQREITLYAVPDNPLVERLREAIETWRS